MTSAIITEKKSASFPPVNRKTMKTKAEPTTPRQEVDRDRRPHAGEVPERRRRRAVEGRDGLDAVGADQPRHPADEQGRDHEDRVEDAEAVGGSSERGRDGLVGIG